MTTLNSPGGYTSSTLIMPPLLSATLEICGFPEYIGNLVCGIGVHSEVPTKVGRDIALAVLSNVKTWSEVESKNTPPPLIIVDECVCFSSYNGMYLLGIFMRKSCRVVQVSSMLIINHFCRTIIGPGNLSHWTGIVARIIIID